MKNIKEKIIGFFISVVGFIVAMMYISGMYLLIANDKYSAKQLVAGSVFPPYAVYIGGKDLYDRGAGIENADQYDNYSIKDYADDMNADLPKMIDDGVQAQSVEAIKKDTLLFRIKLTKNIDASKKKIIYVPFLEAYCEGEMQPFYNARINLIYVINDKNDETFTRFELKPKRCKLFEDSGE